MTQVPSTVSRAAPARTKRLLLVAAVLAVAVHLWGLYRPTGPPVVPWFPGLDKVEHAVGFALPTLLVLLTLRAWRGPVSRRTLGLTAAAFAAHAAVSEIAQYLFYRYRTGDPRDALADLIGVAIGGAEFVLIERGRRPGGAP